MAEVSEKLAATESWSNHEKEVTGKLVASGSSRNSGSLRNSWNF